MLCGLSSSESTTRFHQQNSLASKSSTISYNHTCGALAAKPYFEALASSNSRNGEPEERFIRISSRTQDRDLIFYTSIKPLSPAFSKQDLTDGSTLVPPKADISPRTLGTWIQSPSNRPSFLWFDLLDWSAMRRNMSENVLLICDDVKKLTTYICTFLLEPLYTWLLWQL